jgi:hypothetical protein
MLEYASNRTGRRGSASAYYDSEVTIDIFYVYRYTETHYIKVLLPCKVSIPDRLYV